MMRPNVSANSSLCSRATTQSWMGLHLTKNKEIVAHSLDWVLAREDRSLRTALMKDGPAAHTEIKETRNLERA